MDRSLDSRSKILAALQQTSALMETILDAIPDVIGVQDADNRIIRYNAAGYRWLNMTYAQVVGKRCYELIGRTQPCEICATSRAIAMRQPASITRHETSLGVWLNVRAYPIMDAEGRVVKVIEHLRDVTREREAQEEIKRQRRYIANIVDSMPSAIIGVDPEGRTTQWNREAMRLTGVASPDAYGRFIGEVMPQFQAILPHVFTAMRNRETQSQPETAWEINGETRYCDVTVYPLLDNGHQGAVIRIDDVTARVRIEEMMMQAEKMVSVGNLAAGMAHEINNPLGAILQGAQNVERRVSPALPKNEEIAHACGTDLATIRAYLEQRDILRFMTGIRESAQRAADIVRNMLQFSRRSNAELSPGDVNAVIEQTLDLADQDYDLKRNYDFRRIEIVRHFDPDLPPVPMVASEIQQVLFNIFRNAAEAMLTNPGCAEPQLCLRTQRVKRWVKIEIGDNGPGMDKETRARIFEPFFTTKDVGAGTGLGLAVAYMIIANHHGGTLAVESAPGDGARFIIRLPVERGQRAATHTPLEPDK